jgi:hypothetical protein
MPRPVLSDTAFNADNVATAILNQANLAISNESLGVSDQSSNLQVQSGWSNNVVAPALFTFNGFGFFSCSLYHGGGAPGNPEVCIKITSSTYYPSTRIHMPSVSYQGDTGQFVTFETNGDVSISHPLNLTDSTFYLVVNGWYRYA